MADSFSFGGIDLGGSTYGVIVIQEVIEFMSAPKITSVPIPNAHGSIVRGKYLEEKHLKVSTVVEGTSFSDLQTKLEALRGILSPMNGVQDIIFDYMPNRKISGRLATGTEGTIKAGRAVTMDLEFICPDPTWYGTILQTGDVATGGAAMDINYGGSLNTPLTIIGRHGTGANSSSSSVYVRNATMYPTAVGECEVSPYRLSAGQYIRFDSVREIIETSMDMAEWIPIMQYYVISDGLGVRKGFPELKPGVTNSISRGGITNHVDSFWRYEYYDRFI